MVLAYTLWYYSIIKDIIWPRNPAELNLKKKNNCKMYFETTKIINPGAIL